MTNVPWLARVSRLGERLPLLVVSERGQCWGVSDSQPRYLPWRHQARERFRDLLELALPHGLRQLQTCAASGGQPGTQRLWLPTASVLPMDGVSIQRASFTAGPGDALCLAREAAFEPVEGVPEEFIVSERLFLVVRVG